MSFNDEFKITRGIKMGVNLKAQRQDNPYDATWVLDAARKSNGGGKSEPLAVAGG